jgi:hypothetical protein
MSSEPRATGIDLIAIDQNRSLRAEEIDQSRTRSQVAIVGARKGMPQPQAAPRDARFDSAVTWGAQSGQMFGRGKTLLVTLAVLAGSVSTSAFVEFGNANAAMHCCAKTQYACAGVGTPDDCCRKMHHRSSRATPSIVRQSTVGHDAAILAPPLTPFFAVVVRERFQAAFDWNHPHDPPHLHTFSLLI